MPDNRLTRIALRPRITVAGEAREERVRRLCVTAHARCNVANSLRTEVTVEPLVERA
jgi:organic hydroperoxide reductase OsmC/OhrA